MQKDDLNHEKKTTVVVLLRKLRIRSAYNRGDYEVAKNALNRLLIINQRGFCERHCPSFLVQLRPS